VEQAERAAAELDEVLCDGGERGPGVGRRAFGLLHAQLETGQGPAGTAVLPTRLVIRESTGPLTPRGRR
jgi:hypothetical protein